MLFKMPNTGNLETDNMVTEFMQELKYMEKGRSTMMGSQIYINLMEYVKKLCYDNNFNNVNENEDEENIIDEVRQQLEYDFNTLERASSFMMGEKLDYFSIQWLENAYEYHKWEEGFDCIVEAKLESKVNFMMYCVAREYCEKWIEAEELDIHLW